MLSQADRDLVAKVEKAHKIVLFKGPEYDPERYAMVKPLGERFFFKNDSRHEIQRVRDISYEFRGATWPKGVPVGVTKLYQKKYAESADSEDRVFINAIMDISWSEQQQMKHYAQGQTPWTTEARDKRTLEREALRQKASEDALTPNAAVAQTIATAIKQALTQNAAESSVAVAEPPKRKPLPPKPEDVLAP